MSWVNIKRVARYGVVGFIRNGFVSLAAVFIMTITLFTILWVLIIGAGFQTALSWLTNQVDVSVYFKPSATPDQVQALKDQIDALPQVATTTVITSDQALEQFKERHANDQLELQALQELGENPLGPALEVRAKETSQYSAIAKYISDLQQNGAGGANVIDKVNYQQNEEAIQKLSNFINALRTFGLAAGIILAAAAVLITFNTIRLAIYTARDEIGIMNIVGAGGWYVRGPFLVAGLLYGVVGSVIVLLVSYPLSLWLGPASEHFFGTFNVFTYYTSHFTLLLFATVGTGVILGAVSSFLAVRRYLRM
jgi:cell division transport system permease protein